MGMIMIFLLAILSLFLVWTLWGRMVHALQMLQQCHYMNDRFTTWMAGHRLVVLPVPLCVLVILYWVLVVASFLVQMSGTVLTVGTLVIGLLGLGMIKLSSGVSKESKKPLKITARVWRIIATGTILMLLIAGLLLLALQASGLMLASQIAGLLLTFNLLAYVLMLLANGINKPMEKSIRLGFINDARHIVKESASLDVIGVTGSYGKTSTKHALNAILSEQFNTLMTPESYNTPMGITITIRNYLKPIHNKFIAEMGAYKVGEIKELCEIAYPKYGVLTSVGPQHLETFKTIDHVKQTKFELIEYLPEDGIGLINIDDENIRDYYEHKFSGKCTVYTYGIDHEADYRASDIVVSEKGTTFKVTFRDGSVHSFQTKLLGHHNIYNTVASIALGNELGIPVEKMQVAVRKMKPVTHRLELRRNGNFTIIDDAFNSNPVGSKMALEVLGQMNGKRIVLTPGMVDLGTAQYDLNKAFGTYMKETCDYVILVGKKQTEPIQEGLKEVKFPEDKITVAENLTEAFKVMYEVVEPGAFVLIENDLPELFAE
ncbi:MAG: UDP-N-acetylmuramoyl-tripeptide--D-alanyl-D-alanine ligase [Turicibacter sp.]|nr:UDP-N-acetylmuramoyl-tripeptide--D-alanyl-D-alanine ligase [Turicibacter sp.]